MKITHQLKAAKWKDETQMEIPANRITKSEKLKEKCSFKLATEAFKIFKLLLALKIDFTKICKEVLELHLTEKEIAKSKGNLQWYNFDGSIRIDIKVAEQIEFDSILIESCRQKLMSLVGDSIKDDATFIKELVQSAFQTSKGKLDSKKVLGLRRHASKIKDPRYAEAMDLLDQSIRRPESKTYYQVWVRDDNGKYQNIDLNFSSIDITAAPVA